MRRILPLAAIAIAAASLPFAALAQTTVKAEGGTEGTGIKQTAEQPKFVKKTVEQKAANKAERKEMRVKSQGGAPMSDGSVVAQAQEQPAAAKKTAEQKAANKAERKDMSGKSQGGAPMTDGSATK